jgi:toluene monooxygenase electron transfer component
MKIHVNARNRAHQFEAPGSEKLLFAGLSNAIDLPYECGSGTCGTCKARLLGGSINDTWPDAPGHKFLKGADEFLLCQCEARSDLLVEVASFVHAMVAAASTPGRFHGQITEVRKLTRDVLSIEVQLDRPMDFDAGQFVMVQVEGVTGHRGWSMVNYERGTPRLSFVVKKKPGGRISEWLFERAVEGAELSLFGPLGRATFFPALAKNILCIAGGSGIAGMMSILARATHEGYFKQYRGDVFFGVRTMQDAFFLEEFENFAQRCGEKLSVTVALSEEPAPDSAEQHHPRLKFEQGLVHDVAARSMSGRYQNLRAYLAGPPPAVDASIRMLLEARVSTDNIRYDKFS